MPKAKNKSRKWTAVNKLNKKEKGWDMKLTINFNKNEDKRIIREIRNYRKISHTGWKKVYQSKYLKNEELFRYKTEIGSYSKSEIKEFQCFLEKLPWIDRSKVFVELETGYGNVGIRVRDDAEAFLIDSISKIDEMISILNDRKNKFNNELNEFYGISNSQIVIHNKKEFESMHRQALEKIRKK